MLTVDPSLPTPPFEQVKEQLTELRTTGALPAHHRLPTVRHLAAELGHLDRALGQRRLRHRLPFDERHQVV